MPRPRRPKPLIMSEWSALFAGIPKELVEAAKNEPQPLPDDLRASTPCETFKVSKAPIKNKGAPYHR